MKHRATRRRPRWGAGMSLVVASALTAAGLVAGPLMGVPLGAAEALRPVADCTSTRGSFVPTRVDVRGLGLHRVLPVGRAADGSMGTPPTDTRAGLWSFGWYRPAAKPGEHVGGVVLTAHTWYDHHILGDQLLDWLHEGDLLTVSGRHRTQQICYRVVKRQAYRAQRAPMGRLVSGRVHGQQLGIVVCSGRRTERAGVASYSHRTVWIARPVRHHHPTSPDPTVP